MKIFFQRLLVLLYLLVSMGILMLAMIYPFLLGAKDSPPLWTCFVLYTLALIIAASQFQVLKWADKVMKDN